jgi:hypothetical protein
MVATMIRWRVSSPLAPTGRPSCARVILVPYRLRPVTDTVKYNRLIN